MKLAPTVGAASRPSTGTSSASHKAPPATSIPAPAHSHPNRVSRVPSTHVAATPDSDAGVVASRRDSEGSDATRTQSSAASAAHRPRVSHMSASERAAQPSNRSPSETIPVPITAAPAEGEAASTSRRIPSRTALTVTRLLWT